MIVTFDQLIRVLIPIAVIALWALTRLFTQETKPFPARNSAPPQPFGPRPGDPTLRWSTPPSSAYQVPATRRVPIGDDDILIIPSDAGRNVRPGPARPAPVAVSKRSLAKSRAQNQANRKQEPPVQRNKLGSDVNQNVNQHITQSIDLTPMLAISPMGTLPQSPLVGPDPSATRSTAVFTVSSLSNLVHDPKRLREAFLVNELLRPPLALRKGAWRRG
jgi:hypothetical protein